MKSKTEITPEIVNCVDLWEIIVLKKEVVVL